MSGMKPCPFCGKEDLYFEQDEEGKTNIVCDWCEYKTRIFQTIGDAARWWNTRPIEDTLNKRIAGLEALVDELKPYRDGYDGEFLEPTDDRFYLIRHTNGQLVTWRKVDNHEDINFLGWGAKGKPRRYWRLPEVQE